MNESMVKNHISLKTGFGYNATRTTSFLSWFQACQRVRPPVLIIQLQGHLQDRRGLVLHLPQARLLHQRQHHQVTVRLAKERIELKVSISNVDDRTGQPVVCRESNHEQGRQANQKLPKPNKKETTLERGNPLSADSSRASSETRSGCKNSGKIWWMMKFQYMEILTPVLLMKYLQSPHSRDLRIWVSTLLRLTSLKTEIARSVRGPRLQGHLAEDALVEPYFVQKIWVT